MGEPLGDKDKYSLLSELLAAMQNWNTAGETSLGTMTGAQFFSTAISGLRAQRFNLNETFALEGQAQAFNLLRAASYYGNAEAVQVLASNGVSPRDNSSAVYFAIKGLIDSPTNHDPQTRAAYQQTFNALADGGANLGTLRQKLEQEAANVSGRGGKEEKEAKLAVAAFNALESGYKSQKGQDRSVTTEELPPPPPASASAAAQRAPLSAVKTGEEAWARIDAIRENIRQQHPDIASSDLMYATAAGDGPEVTAALSNICAVLSADERQQLAEARRALHDGGLMEAEKPEKPAAKTKARRSRD